MKEEEEKTLRKRLELAAKIKEDRMRRKAEQEKKPEFKIKKKPTDKKFNKFYTNMVEKDKMKKEKFAKFTEVVKDYEMRECVFQPNLTDYDENRYKNLNSNKIVHRLYDDELKSTNYVDFNDIINIAYNLIKTRGLKRYSSTNLMNARI